MMGEMSGGLIEMNARMVMTDKAVTLLAVGIMLAVIFLIAGFMGWLEGKKCWWVCFVGVVAFAAMAMAGYRMPRVKEIRACVSGPLSLEVVATRYDIVNVDGKELVLRER